VFNQADYHSLLGANWTQPIRVLIPIVVVDELDGLKDARTEVRHRARFSLAILDRVMAGSPQEPHELRPSQLRQVTGQIQAPTGDLTVEVLLDPMGHARLPIVDDEIIDRALAIQPLAGRRVTLLTCDTAQSFQARSVGLNVVKAPRKNQAAELREAQKAEASKN
jgi:predicted ribonuclease YlaK